MFAFALLFCLNLNAQTLVPPDTALAHYVPVQFQTHDGLTLSGHLALPKSAPAPFPAVLLLVGSGPGNRYEQVPGRVTATGKSAQLFRPIETALLEQGIAVMTYEKRGVNPVDNTFEENRVDPDIFGKASANDLASDALQAFDTFRAQKQLDQTRLGVLGHSEGTILALKVIEQRPQDVRSLFMMGLLTRSMSEIFDYQGIVNQMRLFNVVDDNHDGYLTENEVQSAVLADPVLAKDLDWSQMKNFDQTGDGRVSEQEFHYILEEQNRQFRKGIEDGTLANTPSYQWIKEYLAEGRYLERQLPYCSKIHLFQGEIDIQTPYEDVLELSNTCGLRKTPLASFISYPNLGHGFSPRVGFKNARDTIGPIDPKLPQDIAIQAARDLLAPTILIR